MDNTKGSEWRRWDLHLHTASSYDYKYKSDDADEVLYKTLVKNGIAAVAITDHFKIDCERINHLRSLGDDVVFFPGVELRTDKGSSNVHVILIFSNEVDLNKLSNKFDVIMRDQKAKSNGRDETIYWDFTDIVKFAEENDALISIHAGSKTNGLDKEISNNSDFKLALKDEYDHMVDFYEIGKREDIKTYKEHVFKDLGYEKPLIICSDNHDPRKYEPKERLWIKADLTFEGLKQCTYMSEERIYIGDRPPVLDRIEKDPQRSIASVSVNRVDRPDNPECEWFNFELPLNPSMIAVIGNKGSGKSAFSDIIGHLCRCHTMDNASFLNPKRFRKTIKCYAKDYEASLKWKDEEFSGPLNLNVSTYDNPLEDAQYLPQKYIEDVCNDFGDKFQNEIDDVIFSYVDKAERGEAKNMKELIRNKSGPLLLRINELQKSLDTIISRSVALEDRMAPSYKKDIETRFQSLKSVLERHEKAKPIEVQKPEPKENDDAYRKQLSEINEKIEKGKAEIQLYIDKTYAINDFLNEANTLVTEAEILKTSFDRVKSRFEELSKKYGLSIPSEAISLNLPIDELKKAIFDNDQEKITIEEFLMDPDNGMYSYLEKLNKQKEQLIASATEEERKYQKYLSDLEYWENQKDKFIGSYDQPGSIAFYEEELKYIKERSHVDYELLINERNQTVRELFGCKKELMRIYENIYNPIQKGISGLLGDAGENISFKAEIYLKNDRLADDLVMGVSQRYKGTLGYGKGVKQAEDFVKKTDFSDEESVMGFVKDLTSVALEDLDNVSQRISDRKGFYRKILYLNYIDVNFKLKMGDRSLEELSPGERGLVLLIFYLALSKESKPIIIDQPEDNLDNQSVFDRLVPCIRKAKQRRQIIIVTHNPNIAVACDAEQIVYCEMDKKTSAISYASGSIENPIMRKHVVDVLEGTMPAFNLRRKKYD